MRRRCFTPRELVGRPERASTSGQTGAANRGELVAELALDQEHDVGALDRGGDRGARVDCLGRTTQAITVGAVGAHAELVR